MCEYEYYPIKCQFHDQCLYFIYCSGDPDYIACNERGLIGFPNLKSLIAFSEVAQLDPLHKDQCDKLDFDAIRSFSLSQEHHIDDPNELMCCWNLLDDISEAHPERWVKFIHLSNTARYLHERLLFQSDVFSTGEIVKPSWAIEEVALLKNILIIGLDIFRASIEKYKP